MKIHAILAALVLAAPVSALADRRVVVVSRGYSGSHCRVPSYRPHYSSVRYRSSYISPFSIFRRTPRHYGYGPAVSLSYTSASPRYAYSPRYDYAANSIEVDVQRELRRRGYYRGRLDGDIGPESRAAIRAYQADHGLYANGRIDSRLLRSLGI